MSRYLGPMYSGKPELEEHERFFETMPMNFDFGDYVSNSDYLTEDDEYVKKHIDKNYTLKFVEKDYYAAPRVLYNSHHVRFMRDVHHSKVRTYLFNCNLQHMYEHYSFKKSAELSRVDYNSIELDRIKFGENMSKIIINGVEFDAKKILRTTKDDCELLLYCANESVKSMDDVCNFLIDTLPNQHFYVNNKKSLDVFFSRVKSEKKILQLLQVAIALPFTNVLDILINCGMRNLSHDPQYIVSLLNYCLDNFDKIKDIHLKIETILEAPKRSVIPLEAYKSLGQRMTDIGKTDKGIAERAKVNHIVQTLVCHEQIDQMKAGDS